MKVIGALLFLIATGCAPRTDAPAVSTKPAAFLEVWNLGGDWERLALIYGYWDDYAGCLEVVEAMSAKFARIYRCVAAEVPETMLSVASAQSH